MTPPSSECIEGLDIHAYDTAHGTLERKSFKPDAEDFSPENWLRSVFQSTECGTSNIRLHSKSGSYVFKNLYVNVTTSTDVDLKTFATVAMHPFRFVAGLLGRKAYLPVEILRDVEGFVEDGEMLAVLGTSGSGCTTLLKVLSGAAKDLQMKDGSEIMYQGTKYLSDGRALANFH